MKWIQCPHCTQVSETGTTVCPRCGDDLSELNIHNKVAKAEDRGASKTKFGQGYRHAFIVAVAFSIISIFFWSYVFTGYDFDLNIFLGRLANHSFWLLLFPLLIGLIFKKPHRAKVYSLLVVLLIALQMYFLSLGYSMSRLSHDPNMIRFQLRVGCIDESIRQMAGVNQPNDQKKRRAEFYCDCLLGKLSEEDLKSLGRGQEEFFPLAESKDRKEGRECLRRSLEVVFELGGLDHRPNVVAF